MNKASWPTMRPQACMIIFDESVLFPGKIHFAKLFFSWGGGASDGQTDRRTDPLIDISILTHSTSKDVRAFFVCLRFSRS